MTSGRLSYFLGIKQCRELAAAYQTASSTPIQFETSSFSVLIAVVIGTLPALVPMVSKEIDLDIATILIGLSAALAIAFRSIKKFPFQLGGEFRKSLSLVHTAVAIGCIPVVLTLIFYSEALYQLGGALGQIDKGTESEKPSLLLVLAVITQVSVWVAVTEEFIFRGLLISVLRRWRAIKSQSTRDFIAIVLSSMLFGLAHLHQWGPLMSLGLTGLGIGFGIGYLAIKEQILPLIIYHALFDALSLSYSIFG